MAGHMESIHVAQLLQFGSYYGTGEYLGAVQVVQESRVDITQIELRAFIKPRVEKTTKMDKRHVMTTK